MDLLTLAAKIELDDSSYTKGVAKAEKVGKQLQGKMNAMTVAAGNLVADMVRKGVSGINQVISGAIDGYADYQQLIGGVETLFKGSADTVAKYAKKSFKTTGLSANDYMETVTSFSASLIQGLGGDTAQAAASVRRHELPVQGTSHKGRSGIPAAVRYVSVYEEPYAVHCGRPVLRQERQGTGLSSAVTDGAPGM